MSGAIPFVLLSALAGGALVLAQTSDPVVYRLALIGHEIGRETDTTAPADGGRELRADFHFVDRGTAVDLAGTLALASNRDPRHLLVKGKTYRLFASDSDVSVGSARAHVRDLTAERDVDLAGKPFFPVDNYAPIGVQEALIQYWLAHRRPDEIAAAPSGPIRIRSRAVMPPRTGRTTTIERLAIEGVVWGTETAWIEQESGHLLGVMTWAGALPFQALRAGAETLIGQDWMFREAVADRIEDLTRLTSATPVVERDRFALVGATVITGTEAAPILNATVVIRDGRIAAVGASASTPVPKDTPAVNVRGRTIVAGLWDMHAHASQVDWAPVYLASGVTTIRDMGGEEGFLVAIRDAIASGRAMGPRYLLAGLVDGPGPHAFGAVTAGTPEEGIAVTREYHDQRFNEMKIYTDVPADVVAAIITEAHRLGMTVTGHVPTSIRTAQAAVEAGFDGIAHSQLRGASGSDATTAQIAFFKAHHTVMDPTMSWNELGGRPAATPLESLLPGVSRLPRPLARMFASMSAGSADPQAAHARLIESVKLVKDAVDAGLLVVAGTDKGVPGLSLQRELELYVEAGMTPMQALQTATIMPARAMRLERDTGTIEAGKRADLVVLGGNPLEDIHRIRDARLVVAAGRLYDCDALWRAAGYGPRPH